MFYANYGILVNLIVRNDASQTARNIEAHEQMFRMAIGGDLLYSVGIVALVAALYVIFRPVNSGLALFATLSKFIYALMWVLMTLGLLDAVPLLTAGAERLHALSALNVGGRWDQYYVGLLFESLASSIYGYLWLKSRYIPKPLALLVLISSAWCAACTFAFIVEPRFAAIVNINLFDAPILLLDVATGLWLLFRGLAPAPAAG